MQQAGSLAGQLRIGNSLLCVLILCLGGRYGQNYLRVAISRTRFCGLRLYVFGQCGVAGNDSCGK